MKISLKELAELTQSKLNGDPNFHIEGFADLANARANEISFYSPPPFDRDRQQKTLQETKASALFVTADISVPSVPNILVHENPSQAFQQVVEAFTPDSSSGFTDIHPTAVIHKSAQIDKGAQIGPHVVIDQGVMIGENTIIHAGTCIGPFSRIGKGCVIHPNVTIRERCIMQDRVTLQPGVVIGSCGFGYTTSAEGKHIHIKQLGTVILESDVEIGANTTVDRARFQKTIIKRGTKIDNLVQIGHGVEVGEDNLIVSQTGIAGGTKTGHHVVLGGQVAVNGHISLTNGVVVTARSAVSKSLTKPGKYGGVPVQELSEHNRTQVLLRGLQKRLSKIHERLDLLEQKDS